MVECLKGVYTSLMEQVKKEEMEREQSEKGFLTVVEQVIARIVDYWEWESEFETKDGLGHIFLALN